MSSIEVKTFSEAEEINILKIYQNLKLKMLVIILETMFGFGDLSQI